MNVISVDATRIVPTQLVASAAPTALFMNCLAITKLGLVRLNPVFACLIQTKPLINLSLVSNYAHICYIYINLDIDECALNISGCNQNCTNTNGSYFCSCYPGYEIENDNTTCIGKHLML